VQQDSIERIRSATFSISRKGYDKREVERFLSKLAEWLETGGGDQARTDLVKRELERVGEKTGRILSEAEDSAEQLRIEAEQEATEIIDRAKQQAASAREAADEYAIRTRQSADEDAKKVRHEAEVRAQEGLARAAQQARESVDDAESKARRLVEDGAKRRSDVEAVISDLEHSRDALLSGVEQLTNDMKSVVAGYSETAGTDRSAAPPELDREAGAADGESTEAPVAAEPKAKPAKTRTRKRAKPSAR
jgi:DivIVA domain-containing protein